MPDGSYDSVTRALLKGIEEAVRRGMSPDYGYGEEPYPPLQQRCQTGKWEDTAKVFSQWSEGVTDSIETPPLVPQPFLRAQSGRPRWWNVDLCAVERVRNIVAGPVNPEPLDVSEIPNDSDRCTRLKARIFTGDMGRGCVRDIDIATGAQAITIRARAIKVNLLVPFRNQFPPVEDESVPSGSIALPGTFLDTLVSGEIHPGLAPVGRGVALSTVVGRIPTASGAAVQILIPFGVRRLRVYQLVPGGGVAIDSVHFMLQPPGGSSSAAGPLVAPIEFDAGTPATSPLLQVPGNSCAVTTLGTTIDGANDRFLILVGEVDL